MSKYSESMRRSPLRARKINPLGENKKDPVIRTESAK